jgi:SAM-dependent methyltransferase
LTTPHSSWAEIYDLVYQKSFGKFYRRLTNTTIKQVESRVRPPARVIDFGAGTGRLSIPLAAKGYRVTAVEPCQEMLTQLRLKPGSEEIDTVTARMQDFQSSEPFDMALCVFTVLLYLLDDASLNASLQAASNALRPGGLLLLDIPVIGVFEGYQTNTPEVQRSVQISPQGMDLYLYQEETRVQYKNHSARYSDQFLIRYWEVEHVMAVLARYGFSLEEDLEETFWGAGSHYFLFRKTRSG